MENSNCYYYIDSCYQTSLMNINKYLVEKFIFAKLHTPQLSITDIQNKISKTKTKTVLPENWIWK